MKTALFFLRELRFHIFLRNYVSCSTQKLVSPLHDHLISGNDIKYLWNIFIKNNYELRLVGGAVRDTLLNKKPYDFDFATDANPTEMSILFSNYNLPIIANRGEKFGSFSIKVKDTCYNITTLRKDICSDGRYCHVEFIKDWTLDASRRDFTFNALYLDYHGNLYDYYNGWKDLIEGKVVFVGNAEERVKEDYLRVLRYFRFYSCIATSPDYHNEELMNIFQKHSDGLASLSGPRVWKEFQKLLCGNQVVSVVKMILNLGIEKYFGLPKKLNILEFENVCSKGQHLKPNPITLLVALLSSEKEFSAVTKYLKLTSDEQRLGEFLLLHRFTKNEDVLKFCKDLLTENVFHRAYVYELLKYKGDFEALKTLQNWSVPKFPISARILIDRGIEKQHVNKILRELKEYWKQNNFNENDLLQYINNIYFVSN